MKPSTRRNVGESLLLLVASFLIQVVIARPGDSVYDVAGSAVIGWLIGLAILGLITWTYKK